MEILDRLLTLQSLVDHVLITYDEIERIRTIWAADAAASAKHWAEELRLTGD
jgi:hypothetical protein